MGKKTFLNSTHAIYIIKIDDSSIHISITKIKEYLKPNSRKKIDAKVQKTSNAAWQLLFVYNGETYEVEERYSAIAATEKKKNMDNHTMVLMGQKRTSTERGFHMYAEIANKDKTGAPELRSSGTSDEL